MKDVGIITIFGGTNYGNKLQNYALQKYLRDNNIDSETIRYRVTFPKHHKGIKDKIKIALVKYFSDGLNESIYNLNALFGKYIHKSVIENKKSERQKEIELFEKNNIMVSERVYNSEDDLKESNDLYRKFIVGSDQVWNPYWQGSKDEFFLSFADREKRIAYAPSIGVSLIPDVMIERYVKLLDGFKQLSCREKEGSDLITKLVERVCLNVVDPVFLLDSDEWKEIANPPKYKNYIVTYFLAGMSATTFRKISEYAREKSLKIIDIYNEESTRSQFACIEDFISLIANADIVFTDSFHGCAFSIIFKRQFVVCDRRFQKEKERMNSRIDGLLERLEIKNRNIVDDYWKALMIDYDVVDRILTPWIEMSKQFLLSEIN